MRTSNYLAAVILLCFPAISVELLSGDTQLATYLKPMAFITLNITYGGALLLIRETVVRWRKGFASVLMFAAGYGMLNEALGSKGFFDPHFYSAIEFGLEGFGRAFGINVPWALNISIIHAVFSILVPFVLISTIFSGQDRWIGNKLYVLLLVLLVVDTVFVFNMFAIPPSFYHYDEGPGPLLLILSLMALVVLAAWKMPRFSIRKWNIHLKVAVLFALGVIYTFGLISLPGHVRTATNSPMVYELFLLFFFVALPILLIFKLPTPTACGKVALAAGLSMPWLLHGLVEHTPGTFFAVAVVLVVLAAAFWRSFLEQTLQHQ